MSGKNTPVQSLDMFGNPSLPLRDRRGRKSFKKTLENQDFVAVRAADGWSHENIADEIGCDPKTLRKYFSRELRNGVLIVEGMCLDILMKRVREGHTPSVEKLFKRLERSAPLPPVKPKPSEKTTEPAVKLGKKEIQMNKANEVDDDYGDIYNRMGLN